jgi:hypothetical protein
MLLCAALHKLDDSFSHAERAVRRGMHSNMSNAAFSRLAVRDTQICFLAFFALNSFCIQNRLT